MSARTNQNRESPPTSARAMAFGVAALFMLVPANVLPVLSSKLPGEVRTDTIYSGTVHLVQTGLWPIALIVFVASIMVPFLKLGGLWWLLWSVRHGTHHPVRMTKVFRVIDEIGRWSMLDVFLVAFLAGAVEFGGMASVEPRLGIVAFAAAVVLTMLATHAFDPRLLWPSPRPSASS
jgi:paraquat-inducible protein A